MSSWKKIEFSLNLNVLLRIKKERGNVGMNVGRNALKIDSSVSWSKRKNAKKRREGQETANKLGFEKFKLLMNKFGSCSEHG